MRKIAKLHVKTSERSVGSVTFWVRSVDTVDFFLLLFSPIICVFVFVFSFCILCCCSSGAGSPPTERLLSHNLRCFALPGIENPHHHHPHFQPNESAFGRKRANTHIQIRSQRHFVQKLITVLVLGLTIIWKPNSPKPVTSRGVFAIN